MKQGPPYTQKKKELKKNKNLPLTGFAKSKLNNNGKREIIEASKLKTYKKVHRNLCITPLLGSKAEIMLVKQPCYTETKMYRLYRKMTIYGHFSI